MDRGHSDSKTTIALYQNPINLIPAPSSANPPLPPQKSLPMASLVFLFCLFVYSGSMKELPTGIKRAVELYSTDAFLGASSCPFHSFLPLFHSICPVTDNISLRNKNPLWSAERDRGEAIVRSCPSSGGLHSADLWHCTHLVAPKARIHLFCPQSPTIAVSAPSGGLHHWWAAEMEPFPKAF